MGLDANCYLEKSKDKQDFDGFMAEIKAQGFTSVFGDDTDQAIIKTTCNARTSLQPQLNKAIRYKDQATKADCNPKDTLIFYKSQFAVIPGNETTKNPVKDNTGSLEYMEETVFPTLDFPSDHGVVCVAL